MHSAFSQTGQVVLRCDGRGSTKMLIHWQEWKAAEGLTVESSEHTARSGYTSRGAAFTCRQWQVGVARRNACRSGVSGLPVAEDTAACGC